MLLTAAAVIAYNRSSSSSSSFLDPKLRNSNSNINSGNNPRSPTASWPDDLLQTIPREAIGRCWSPTEGAVAEEEEEVEGTTTKMAQNDMVANNTANGNNNNGAATTTTTTSFRNDVRKEWIRAVFGDSLYDDDNTEAATAAAVTKMGLAKIAPYKSYRMTIPIPKSSEEKLGMTISRLTLGLYVRQVRGEAACAGVLPNSVLVAINGLVLLAEPSKYALERLWRYEGRRCSDEDEDNADIDNDNNDNDDDLLIQDPIQLTLIHSSKLYSVVLLSTPAPFGIDWAPCGNFALVKKSWSYCSKVPVGAILSKVGEDVDLYDLDHVRCAEEFMRCCSSANKQAQQKSDDDHNKDTTIEIQFCIPPAEMRSGYYERNQSQVNNNNNNKKKLPNAAAVAATGKENGESSSSNHHNDNSKNNNSHNNNNNNMKTRRRPDAVAQHDGVEVRVHSLFSNLGGGGGNANQPALAGSLSKLANRVASGELYSMPQQNQKQQQQQQRRKRSSRPRQSQQHHNGHLSSPFQRIILPCPPLPSPLLECWSMEEALLYLLEYQDAGYDELKLNRRAKNNDDRSSLVLSYLQKRKNHTLDGYSSFLIHILYFASCQSPTIRNQLASSMLLLLRRRPSDDETHGSDNDNSTRASTATTTATTTKSTTTTTTTDYYRMELLAQALEWTELQQDLRLRREEIREEVERALPMVPSMDSSILSEHPSKAPPPPSHVSMNSLQSMKSIGTNTAANINNNNATNVNTTDTNTNTDGSVTTTTATLSTPPIATTGTKKKSKKALFSFFRKKKSRKYKNTTLAEGAATDNVANNDNYSHNTNNNKSQSNHSSNSSSRHVKLVKESSQRSPETATTTTTTASNTSNENNTSTPASPRPSQHRHPILHSPARSQRQQLQMNDDYLFSNTLLFLEELQTVCADIEKFLLKSFSQKLAGWALQPWSASKETALAQVTDGMRERLAQYAGVPLLNPMDPTNVPLNALDAEQCFILPSAHFPLLLTFDIGNDDDNKKKKKKKKPAIHASKSSSSSSSLFGQEKLYRTNVELVQISSKADASSSSEEAQKTTLAGRRYVIHGSVAGVVMESDRSVRTSPRRSNSQTWDTGNVFSFDCRSSWGSPQTLSLSVSQVLVDDDDGKDKIVSSDGNGKLAYQRKEGYSWLDLAPLWDNNNNDNNNNGGETCHHVKVWNSLVDFDEHGEVAPGNLEHPENLELEIRVTTKVIESPTFCAKRSLLYKHDDDVRQEMVATEFVKSCDDLLKASGLDLHLLTFNSIPVGKQRGFIEWVPGSVPLSEICQGPFSGGSRILARKSNSGGPVVDGAVSSSTTSEEDPLSSVAKAGLFKYQSLHRVGSADAPRGADGSPAVPNPIQDFLRSFAFDANDPYMIRKSVMERYVKSCAGYCVITYLLGVGDRHLDNLLLHPSGHFFHCDYSFILGNDPKKYQPLRMTQDMVNGMGGPESDNFAMFMSSTCAAFLTFRRPENVRHILSFVRVMEGCGLTETEGSSKKQKNGRSMEECLLDIRQRLRLDLVDDDAITYMEGLIHESCSSKLWLAVDAMHSLGKRF